MTGVLAVAVLVTLPGAVVAGLVALVATPVWLLGVELALTPVEVAADTLALGALPTMFASLVAGSDEQPVRIIQDTTEPERKSRCIAPRYHARRDRSRAKAWLDGMARSVVGPRTRYLPKWAEFFGG